MNHTRKIAEFCSSLSYENMPEEVIRKAKLCILDYIANIYGSLELEAVSNVVEYIKALNTGGAATVLGCGFTTDIHNAAFINGTTAEAIEAQDGLRFGGNHPGAAVIPAALALGETLKTGGKKIIESVVAGYEAADRPAAAMHPWHTLKGFLPTGTCGAFGAAAAASKIWGHDYEHTLNAIGNAGYLTPLSMAEHLMGGYTIKIVQGGQAAQAGLMAAGLAGKGLTGAPHVLEGSELNGGFTQITTAADPKMEKLSEGLGEHYSIMDIYFKPYTACRHTHGSAQAVLELLGERKIDPADIKEIDVFTYGIAELAVGKGIEAGASFVSAQFSIPYVAAVCLLDGKLGPGQLTEKRMTDQFLLELSGKVNVHADEDLNSVYPEKTSSRVEIKMNNGDRLVRQIDIPDGDPRKPLEEKGLSEKVINFAGERDSNRINNVIEAVLNLERVTDIRELTNAV